MAIYGWRSQYAEQVYGTSDLPRELRKHSIGRNPLGQIVRKSIDKRVTFRNRTGNGHQDSILGKKYQEKFKYTVPSSINNVESADERILFASAVAYWKNTLSSAEKKAYNIRANHGLNMSGYNLFIREVLLKTRIL